MSNDSLLYVIGGQYEIDKKNCEQLAYSRNWRGYQTSILGNWEFSSVFHFENLTAKMFHRAVVSGRLKMQQITFIQPFLSLEAQENWKEKSTKNFANSFSDSCSPLNMEDKQYSMFTVFIALSEYYLLLLKGKYILDTSFYHQILHSRRQKCYNFCTVSSFWIHIFPVIMYTWYVSISCNY